MERGEKNTKLNAFERISSFSDNISGLSTSFFNAIMASKGMVNSAITRMDATVRNLA